jgi:hypothetical protein
MLALAEITLDMLFSVIVDLLLIGTGELLLCAFTRGKRKPRFRFWSKELRQSPPELTSLSALAGLLFWMAIVLWVVT